MFVFPSLCPLSCPYPRLIVFVFVAAQDSGLKATVGVAEDAKHVNNWSLEGVEGLPEGGVLDIGALGLERELKSLAVGNDAGHHQSAVLALVWLRQGRHNGRSERLPGTPWSARSAFRRGRWR